MFISLGPSLWVSPIAVSITGSTTITGSIVVGPQFFDCVWLIKRFNADNIADAALLRLREVLLGDGWLQYGKVNSLEIRRGVTSQAPLLARYTAKNVTDINVTFVSTSGLYIRLRGGFYSTDKLSFLFTAVKNVTKGGNGCPGYFDFMCENLYCIEHNLVCDGVDHCSDGSDEAPAVDCTMSGMWNPHFQWNMPYVTDSPQASKLPLPPCDGILCSYTCITVDQICDGYVDCPGREDEDNCANQLATTMNYYSGGMHTAKPCISIVVAALVSILVVCDVLGSNTIHFIYSILER
ncbi:low-density lipoprotein receptor-related protein [Plakobranchus ocellatus]|uniref:Low-density lipoprotein receptor-related protein n=1 Tax=Plakobranchus ocellatus TaxID=259542 RepID=A0AAV4CES9_9GAST|nr:low-density lipoprotein receptor-related protein [Plakobranchus ocellatus]